MDEQWERIYLQDLRAACIIGVREAERRQTQEVRIDICLEVDVREAGRSDRLEDTVDYGVLAREVIAKVEESSFQLLERLAEEIAAVCMESSKVQAVDVKVTKPHALPRGSGAAVEIHRDRGSSRRPMGFGRLV